VSDRPTHGPLSAGRGFDAQAPLPGLFDSPWPAEDGGPRRQLVPRHPGLGVGPGERLVATTRPAFMANMVVLRGPGEVFLQGSGPPGSGGIAWVERIDPMTLATLARSPDLPAGHAWWPGGIVAHANGSLYVTHGRFCHKLGADLALQASRELPRATPYNSLLVCSDGTLVMKNQVRDGSGLSYLTRLEPERLDLVGGEAEVPEASIARLSKDLDGAGDAVYVVGEERVFRFRLTEDGLARDPDFAPRYRTLPPAEQSYGWDAVIADGGAWLMDNGANDYQVSLRGRGTASGPLHLIRVDLASGTVESSLPFGLPGGTIVNPPLVDPSRRIAVAFDSGNERIAGFRYGGGELVRLWEQPFGAANHFLLYPDSGEIVVNDFRGGEDHVVVLDVSTGAERGRVAVQSPMQSVLFQCPGFGRDLYWCSFTTVARVSVEA
jgi:hypothetical protein